jgi:hypothetical protein
MKYGVCFIIKIFLATPYLLATTHLATPVCEQTKGKTYTATKGPYVNIPKCIMKRRYAPCLRSNNNR